MSESGDVIKFMEHQTTPVEYLVAKTTQQKGIVLAHYMGAGKTFTSLLFCKNFPKRRKLIICPPEIVDVWRIEMEKFGIDKKEMSEYLIMTYDDIYARIAEGMSIKDVILIMDEAHYIIDILQNPSMSSEKLAVVMEWLKQPFKLLLLSGTPVRKAPSDLRWLINIAAGKEVVPYMDMEFKKAFYSTSVLRSAVFGYVFPIVFSSMALMLDANAGVNTIFMCLATEGCPVPAAVIGASLGFIISMILTLYGKSKLDRDNLQSIDISSVSTAIAPYVSYFRYPDVYVEGKFPFPTMSYSVKTLSYSSFQLDMLMRMCSMILTAEDLVKMGRSKTLKEAQQFGEIKTMEEFLKYGRAIGNVTEVEDGDCAKFIKVLDTIGQESAVVYSCFHEGGMIPFTKFLTRHKVKFGVYMPDMTPSEKKKVLDDFKSERIQILVLHHTITHGISIYGADQLHVLEPIDDFAVREQLLARVRRMGSHDHKPLAKRRVVVYEWSCSMAGFVEFFREKWHSFKQWVSNDMQVLWASQTTDFNQSISPDEIIYNRIAGLKGMMNQINKNTEIASIEKISESMSKVSCCIWKPDSDDQMQCMKKNKVPSCEVFYDKSTKQL